MKSNIVRLMECLTCKYIKICTEEISNPEDYPDGTCKTRDLLVKRGNAKDEKIDN